MTMQIHPGGSFPYLAKSAKTSFKTEPSVAVLATAAIAGFRAGYSARCRKPRYTEVGSALKNQHRVAVAVEAVLLPDRFAVGLADQFVAAEGAD